MLDEMTKEEIVKWGVSISIIIIAFSMLMIGISKGSAIEKKDKEIDSLTMEIFQLERENMALKEQILEYGKTRSK